MYGLIMLLQHLTSPNDLLVLCPTQELHCVPLHAIQLDGKALIDRNLIIYTQSLSVLRLCAMPIQSELSLMHELGSLFRVAIVHPLPDESKSTEVVKTLAIRLQE